MLQYKILKSHSEVKKQLNQTNRLIPDINHNIYSQFTTYNFTFYAERSHHSLSKPLINHIEQNKSIGIIVTRLRWDSYMVFKDLDLPFSKVNFFRIKYRYL